MALRKERVVERLVQLREVHGLTQEQAAARVGVTVRQWQRWEAGKSMPYPRNLDMIAAKFGITVADFFDEDVVTESLDDRVQELLAKQNANLARQTEILERLEVTLARIEEREAILENLLLSLPEAEEFRQVLAATRGEAQPAPRLSDGRAEASRATRRRPRATG